jgi:hypothetical protein
MADIATPSEMLEILDEMANSAIRDRLRPHRVEYFDARQQEIELIQQIERNLANPVYRFCLAFEAKRHDPHIVLGVLVHESPLRLSHIEGNFVHAIIPCSQHVQRRVISSDEVSDQHFRHEFRIEFPFAWRCAKTLPGLVFPVGEMAQKLDPVQEVLEV